MNIVSRILIRFSADLIGEDQYGNKYYSQKKTDKRYVIFNGKVEASKIPPMWHAWLHKIISKPPLKRKKLYEWQKEHLPNLTGTAFAVKPQGSLLDRGFRQKSAADYESWTPKK